MHDGALAADATVAVKISTAAEYSPKKDRRVTFSKTKPFYCHVSNAGDTALLCCSFSSPLPAPGVLLCSHFPCFPDWSLLGAGR